MTTTEKTREFEFIEGLTAELSTKNLIFPTSLNATMKIRHALNHPDISNEAAARIVSAEPVLTAQILRLANSVAYRQGGKRVSEVRAATLLLGYGTVRNIAITVGMKQLMEHKDSGRSSQRMEGLWSRSLRVAALAFVIAKDLTRINPDKALLAGLLHDVGKFYILNRARHYQDLFVSEQALWSVVDEWHASIGSAILENWDIAEDIQAAVLDHRNPNQPVNAKPTLLDVVAAADFLDAHMVADTMDAIDWQQVPNALRNLHLAQDNTTIMIEETKEELAQILNAIA